MSKVSIVECPRDAMQGMHDFIPTEVKVAYINQLLKTGFDTIDFGSFVSPKAIPQMRDTAEVLKKLNLQNTTSKLLAIVANVRGAEEAASFDEIKYLGFPFSISETFQNRNTNSTIEESLKTVEQIIAICKSKNKIPVVYISMAFGNPYGDVWNEEVAIKWSRQLSSMGAPILALSDTIGIANPQSIAQLFSTLIPEIPSVTFSAHLHTTPFAWKEKVEAAYSNGCRRFDGAIKGLGGCPMATDKLTGNMPTELMVNWFDENKINTGVSASELNLSIELASKSFPF